MVTFEFLAFSSEDFHTKILQEAAVQSTSHFHAPSSKTWNVTSFESIEMRHSVKINDISTNYAFSLLYETRNFVILFITAPPRPPKFPCFEPYEANHYPPILFI
jgi:hypothetical protein